MTISVVVADPQQRRRRVRVGRFESRARRPLDTPHRLARRLVDAQAGTTDRRCASRAAPARRANPRTAAATRRSPTADRSVRSPAWMSRTRAPYPSKSNDFSMPVPVITQTELAVGHRRRRRHLLLHHPAIAAAERPLPSNCPVRSIDGPEGEIRSVADVEKDVIAPHDWRRSERSGTASFQVTFSVVDQRTGRFFSALSPLSVGPRHCRPAPQARRDSEHQDRHDRGQRHPHPVTPIEETRGAASGSPLSSR